MHLTGETKILGIIGIVTLVLVFGAVVFLSRPEKPIVVDPAKLIKEDSLKISTDSAKLTIVEFGDLQCPACKMAHPGLKQAMADFPGQVNFVFRHYPLPQHKNAQIAAKAIEAANLQGKVWQMYDKLFENQEEWGEINNPVDKFKEYVVGLGMDGDKFAQDINNSSFQSKISQDIADGTSSGVNSTPTFFFNNELYKKGVGYSDFKTEIESRLQ